MTEELQTQQSETIELNYYRQATDAFVIALETLDAKCYKDVFIHHILLLDVLLNSLLIALNSCEPADEDVEIFKKWQEDYDYFNDMRRGLRLKMEPKAE